jgi:hypothetical protein
MIITWDNIDHFILKSDGFFRRTNVSRSLRYVKYVLIEGCERCTDPFFMDIRKVKNGKGCFCSLKCFNKEQSKYRDNKKYKQHYHSYDIYQPQLEPYGVKCRRNKEDQNILEVKCMYCGKWHIPYGNAVRSKCWSIKTGIGECNIYCSDECKKACPTYNQIKYPKDYKINTSREVQPELRKLVLKRDNYTCQKCGITNVELHCHHYEGIEVNPVESADIDQCVTLCKECHNDIHKKDKCGMKNYKRGKC